MKWLRNEETVEFRLSLPEPEQQGDRVATVSARGRMPTESTPGCGALELLVRVPWPARFPAGQG